MRKATQISSGATDQDNAFAVALCDDATLWKCNIFMPHNTEWQQLPPIPQDEDIEGSELAANLYEKAIELGIFELEDLITNLQAHLKEITK